jgi:hypothetical protein
VSASAGSRREERAQQRGTPVAAARWPCRQLTRKKLPRSGAKREPGSVPGKGVAEAATAQAPAIETRARLPLLRNSEQLEMGSIGATPFHAIHNRAWVAVSQDNH